MVYAHAWKYLYVRDTVTINVCADCRNGSTCMKDCTAVI